MDERVKNYYKNNHLYSRKMVVPVAGEKFRNSCEDCKFYITVKGQQATRKLCVSNINVYRTGQKRVPSESDVLELMLLLGKEALEQMINKGGNHQMACGNFEEQN